MRVIKSSTLIPESVIRSRRVPRLTSVWRGTESHFHNLAVFGSKKIFIVDLNTANNGIFNILKSLFYRFTL